MQVMGSASLARQLVENDLVDEYLLMLEPILLGGGKSIFPTDGKARTLELVSVTPAKTGVLICAYRRAGSTAEPSANALSHRAAEAEGIEPTQRLTAPHRF